MTGELVSDQKNTVGLIVLEPCIFRFHLKFIFNDYLYVFKKFCFSLVIINHNLNSKNIYIVINIIRQIQDTFENAV